MGTSARRSSGGVIPSTPGTSPIKFKEESLQDEEDIYGDHPLIPRDHASPQLSDVEIISEAEEEIQPDDEDQEDEEEVLVEPEEPVDEIPIGPETQALFGADVEDEDFRLPNIELQSPVQKQTPRKFRESKFFDDPQTWIANKARRVGVDTELVYWALERTTGRPKLATKTLKYFQKENRTSLPPPPPFSLFVVDW
jgi:hypothetical protein